VLRPHRPNLIVLRLLPLKLLLQQLQLPLLLQLQLLLLLLLQLLQLLLLSF